MTQDQANELSLNLVKLSKEFKSTDPISSASIKRAFKNASKNDTIRTLAYLLEVVGVKDAQFNELSQENKDLKELLKLNNINLDEEANDTKTENGVNAGANDGANVGSTENTQAEAANTQNSEITAAE